MAAASLPAMSVELVEEILGSLPREWQIVFARVSKFANSITTAFMFRNNRLYEGSSAIRKLVVRNNLDGIRLALAHRLDVNATDSDGYTALHHAVDDEARFFPGHGAQLEDVLQLLLDAGADTRAKTRPTELDPGYRTPFELACLNQYYRAALFLLKKQAEGEINLKLNHRDSNRALHLAVQPLCNHLVACHAIHASDEIDYAQKRDHIQNYHTYNIEDLWSNQRELVQQLLGMRGVRVNGRASPFPNQRPLHTALQIDPNTATGIILPDLEVIRLLLRSGARPNAAVLMDAPSSTALELVVKLSSHCYHPAGRYVERRRAFSLIKVTETYFIELVKILVGYGARLDARGPGPWAETPIMAAVAFSANPPSENFRAIYGMAMVALRAMLDCRGPKTRNPENPRPATGGILSQSFLNSITRSFVVQALRGQNWPSIIGTLRILREHGAQADGLERLLSPPPIER